MSRFQHSCYILVWTVPDENGIPQAKSVGCFSERHPTQRFPGDNLLYLEFSRESYHEAYQEALHYLNGLPETHWARKLLSQVDIAYMGNMLLDEKEAENE